MTSLDCIDPTCSLLGIAEAYTHQLAALVPVFYLDNHVVLISMKSHSCAQPAGLYSKLTQISVLLVMVQPALGHNQEHTNIPWYTGVKSVLHALLSCQLWYQPIGPPAATCLHRGAHS